MRGSLFHGEVVGFVVGGRDLASREIDAVRVDELHDADRGLLPQRLQVPLSND